MDYYGEEDQPVYQDVPQEQQIDENSPDFWNQVILSGGKSKYQDILNSAYDASVSKPQSESNSFLSSDQYNYLTSQSDQAPTQPIKSYWEEPQVIDRYHTALQSKLPGEPISDGVDPAWVNTMYDYMVYANGGEKNSSKWKPLQEGDPGLDALRKAAPPPNEMMLPYEQSIYGQDQKQVQAPAQGQRTTSGAVQLTGTQQEQAQQPAFDYGNWNNLEEWEKALLTVMLPAPGMQDRPLASNAIASAGQGVMAGLGGAAIGNAIAGPVGGAIGFFTVGGLTTYQALTGTKIPVLNEALGLFNIPSQGLEQAGGLGVQIKDSGLAEILNHLPSAFSAGRMTYETQMGDWLNWISKTTHDINPEWSSGKQATESEKWAITQGLAAPIPTKPKTGDILGEYRTRLEAGGETQDQIEQDILNQYGDSAIVSDIVSQTILDPTWMIGRIASRGGAKIARVAGLERMAGAFDTMRGVYSKEPKARLAEAAKSAFVDAVPFPISLVAEPILGKMGLYRSQGFLGALQQYRGDIQNGYFPDPAKRIVNEVVNGIETPRKERVPVSELPRIEKLIGGIKDNDTLKGMDPAEKQRLLDLKPEFKAYGMHAEAMDLVNSKLHDLTQNVDMNDDAKVERAAQLMQTLGGMDIAEVGEAGREILYNPLAATVASAIGDFTHSEKLQGKVAEWGATAEARKVLLSIADALQMDPAKLVEELSTNNSTIISRINQTVTRDPNSVPARTANEFITTRQLDEQGLRDSMKVFTEDHKPVKYGQWAAELAVSMADHLEDYYLKFYNIQPDPTWKRLSQLMKSVQSMVLLDLSPTFLVNNMLNNFVTRSAQGVWGIMTPKQSDEWFSRFGMKPEGLTNIETVSGQGGAYSRMPLMKIRKQLTGTGNLARVNRKVQEFRSKFGLVSKLSGKLEMAESRASYTIAAQNMWSQLWKKDSGFRAMDAATEQMLRNIDPDLPDAIYGMVSSGLNMDEINNRLFKSTGVLGNIDMIMNRAIETIPGLQSAPDSIRQLIGEHSGIRRELRTMLENAKTPEDIDRAFDSVVNRLETFADERTQDNLIHLADEVQQDPSLQNIGHLWLNLQDATEIRELQQINDWESVFSIHDEKVRNHAIREQFAHDEAEWRRHNEYELQTTRGILEALGNDLENHDTAAYQLTRSIMDRQQLWKDFYQGYYVRADTAVRDPATGNIISGERVSEGANTVKVDGRRDILRKFFTTGYDTPAQSASWSNVQDTLGEMYDRSIDLERQMQQVYNNHFVSALVEAHPNTRNIQENATAWRERTLSLQTELRNSMARHRTEMKTIRDPEVRRQAWLEFNAERRNMIAQWRNEERTFWNDVNIDRPTQNPPIQPLSDLERAAQPPQTTVPNEITPDNIAATHADATDLINEATSRTEDAETAQSRRMTKREFFTRMEDILSRESRDNPTKYIGINVAEQVKATELLMDLVAEKWGRDNNRNPDEWWTNHIKDILDGGDGLITGELQQANKYASWVDLSKGNIEPIEAKKIFLYRLYDDAINELYNLSGINTTNARQELYKTRVKFLQTPQGEINKVDNYPPRIIKEELRSMTPIMLWSEFSLVPANLGEQSHWIEFKNAIADLMRSYKPGDSELEKFNKEFFIEKDKWLSNPDNERIINGILYQMSPEVARLAHQHGIPTATKDGKPLDAHLLNVVKKYGGPDAQQYAKIGDVPYDVVEAALEKRLRESGVDPTKNVVNDRILRERIFGSTKFDADGLAIIKAFKGANISTFVHELSHVFFRDLSDADMTAVIQLSGQVGMDANGLKELHAKFDAGNTTAEEQAIITNINEHFARGWERYLADPKDASIPAAHRNLFARFTTWITDIYTRLRGRNTIAGSDIDVNIQTKVNINGQEISLKNIFDNLLFDQARMDNPDGATLLQSRPTGNDTIAYGVQNPGERYPMRWRLVELNDPIMSLDMNFNDNPDFPQQLQQRDRGRAASKVQANQIRGKFDPLAMIEDTKQIDRGAPIIDKGLHVISGNGRTWAIRMLDQTEPTRYTQYKELLGQNISNYGINPADFAQFEKPYLVREYMGDDASLERFASESNQGSGLGMSSTEKATVLSDKLDKNAIAKLNVSPDDNYDTAIIRADNEDLKNSFIRGMPSNDRAGYADSTGMMNMDGVNLLKHSLFLWTFGEDLGSNLLEKFTRVDKPEIARISSQITNALPSLAKLKANIELGYIKPEFDISLDVATVFEKLAEKKQEGVPIPQYLTSLGADLFGATSMELSDFQKRLITFIDENPLMVRDTIENYVADALKQRNQETLLQVTEPTSKDVLFDQAIQEIGAQKEAARVQKNPKEFISRVNNQVVDVPYVVNGISKAIVAKVLDANGNTIALVPALDANNEPFRQSIIRTRNDGMIKVLGYDPNNTKALVYETREGEIKSTAQPIKGQTLYQKGKPRQTSMFDDSYDDLPIFSGTPVPGGEVARTMTGIKPEDTTPLPQQARWTETAPEMQGAKQAPDVEPLQGGLFQRGRRRVPPTGRVAPGDVPVSLDQGQVMREAINEHVRPLLERSRQDYHNQVGNGRQLNFDGISPEAQSSVKNWLGDVGLDMQQTKLATMRYAESQREKSMLNYSKRYGIDDIADVFFPYQFWFTRTFMNWSQRMVDRPQWYGMYARIKEAQERLNRQGIPSRLKNKMRLDMPWLPDWAGGAGFSDPLSQLFPFTNFTRPYDFINQEENRTQKSALELLQTWVKDGKITGQQETEARNKMEGPVWDNAYAQASEQGSNLADPYNYVSTLMKPSMFIDTTYKALSGQKEKIDPTPLFRQPRAFKQALKGTPISFIGDVVGLISKPEEYIRTAAGLQEFGKLTDYYIDRQLANMAADGVVTADESMKAMMERQGTTYDQALDRVREEMAIKTPGTLPIYAAKGGANVPQMAAATMASMLPQTLFPTGELKLRGLYDDYQKAWADAKVGDKNAVTKFFNDHPEYRARQLMYSWDDPEGRLRKFMIDNIWQKYYEIGEDNQYLAKEQLGKQFADAFLGKTTRDYESIDIQTLAQWANSLNIILPQVKQVEGAANEKLDLWPQEMQKEITRYKEVRDQQWPDIGKKLDYYRKIPSSWKTTFLEKNPDINRYFKWNEAYARMNPTIAPYLSGSKVNAAAQSKGVPLSNWQNPNTRPLTDLYYQERDKNFPGVDALEQRYFMLDKSGQNKFMQTFPQLRKYWDWKKQYRASNPDLDIILKNKANDYLEPNPIVMYGKQKAIMPLSQQELALFSPELLQQVTTSTFSGDKLGPGSLMALTDVWESLGKPYGDVAEFYKRSVIPTFKAQMKNNPVQYQGVQQ